MRISSLLLLLALTLVPLTAHSGTAAPQSRLDPAKAAEARRYPRIVLFSVAWCPHCRETKEYLTNNNIPFINRDVEQDQQAMELLTGKYGSTGVPVLVFGSDDHELVLKGFTPELFQEYLGKSRTKYLTTP